MHNCQIRFSARDAARVYTTINAGELAGANKPETSETQLKGRKYRTWFEFNCKVLDPTSIDIADSVQPRA
jgi:hypothetical protein